MLQLAFFTNLPLDWTTWKKTLKKPTMNYIHAVRDLESPPLYISYSRALSLFNQFSLFWML